MLVHSSMVLHRMKSENYAVENLRMTCVTVAAPVTSFC